MRWEVGYCIYLSQDRDQWRAVVSTEMNLASGKIRGIYWPAEELLVVKKDSATWSSGECTVPAL
jgi:hypothetical protein